MEVVEESRKPDLRRVPLVNLALHPDFGVMDRVMGVNARNLLRPACFQSSVLCRVAG